eukprot:Nk52_evm51s2657 gene=Nk52_evmTU51s2657
MRGESNDTKVEGGFEFIEQERTDVSMKKKELPWEGEFDDKRTASLDSSVDAYLIREESHSDQVSIRSILVGSLLGAVVSAGSMYISFKAGTSFSSSLFCAIVGFSIMQPLSQRLPVRWGGGYFGPKENVVLQTSGNSASGLSAGFTVAVPVLFWIGYLKSISGDIVSLFFWTLAAAYYGLFFAVPLRYMTIIKQKLKFPTGLATAEVIKAMHASASSSIEGTKKALCILYFFIFGLSWTVFTQFFPFLYNMPIFYYIYQWSGNTAVWARNVNSWRWALNISPAMFGAGMLQGINVALSQLLGGIVCWAILGPLTQHWGWTFDNYGYEGNDFVERPSAQYWLLWPGICIMLVGALFELAWNWRTMRNGIVTAGQDIKKIGRIVVRSVKKDVTVGTKDVYEDGDQEEDLDPAPIEERVPFWWWSSGLVVSSAFTVAVLSGFWDILWYEVVLAIIMAFILSFMAVQVYGETDNNPQGTVAKATQFVFASFNSNQAINVICGNISLCSAGQAGDMLQDLKTGHILNASPRAVFIGQIFGSLAGVFSNVAAFYLIASAYPCLMDLPSADAVCDFAMPSAQSWYGVSYALTHGFADAIPPTAAWASLIGAILTIIVCYIRKVVPEDYKIYVLSPLAFGMAFTFPQPNIIFTQALGGVFMKVWELKFPESYDRFGYPVASGLLSGEGVGGLVVSVLTLSSVTWKSPFGTA